MADITYTVRLALSVRLSVAHALRHLKLELVAPQASGRPWEPFTQSTPAPAPVHGPGPEPAEVYTRLRWFADDPTPHKLSVRTDLLMTELEHSL